MKKTNSKFASLLVFCLLSNAAGAAELKLFVAPNGDDAQSGNSPTLFVGGRDGPVRTVGQAQQLTRALLLKMRAGSVPRQTIRVVMAPGEYQLHTPLVFRPQDSGFVDAPVFYEAERQGTAVITGGTRLSTKQTSGGVVSFNAPDGQAISIFGGTQLFVNGQRAVLARMPNAGSYWFVEKPVVLAGEQGEPGREAFVPERAAREWLANIPQAERGRALLNMMSSWSAGRHRLVDGAASGTIRIKPATQSPFLTYGVSQRFFVENVSTALDNPGEWFWNAGEIKYIPRADESSNALEAVLPLLDKLVEVRGQAVPNGLVENLRFKGIAFKHTRSITSGDGYFDTQAAVAIGAAIEVDGARNLVFDGCEVSSVGGYGIWLRKGVRDTSIVSSIFTDLGAGGVKVGLGDQSPSDVTGTGKNSVLGNTVTETGRLYPGAVGVWVGQSFDNEVSYNTVANTSYSGISVGWKWGYGEARSGRNKVIGNLLFNIGQGNLDDLGAIYHLGMAPGTVIANNLIREVRAYKGYGPGGWGIYLDEGSSNVVVTNNVVVGTDSGGMHLHYGRSNTVTNNVFAGGEDHELLVTRQTLR